MDTVIDQASHVPFILWCDPVCRSIDTTFYIFNELGFIVSSHWSVVQSRKFPLG